MVRVIDGQELAREKEARLVKMVSELKQGKVIPKLVSLVMADDEAGGLYCQLKREAAERIGVKFDKVVIDKPGRKEIIELIKQLNQDKAVQGVMVQRPGVRWGKKQGMKRSEFEVWWQEVVGAIEPNKDVDGLTGKSEYLPATVKAVAEILAVAGFKKETDQVLVVGSEGMVGRELLKWLRQQGARVEGVDVEEKELAKKTLRSDWVIAATGQSNLIKAEMIKPGAGVIDVGWPKGEVEFDKVCKKAGVITPVPGGVGPMTVACLLENLVSKLYTNR